MPQEADDVRADYVLARFAETMREARTKLKLSQKGLADVLGMDRSAITRIESGERDPRLSEAVAIASALGFYLQGFAEPGIDTYTVHLDRIKHSMIEARKAALDALIGVDSLLDSIGASEDKIIQILGTDSLDEGLRLVIGGIADDLESGEGNLLGQEPAQTYWDPMTKEIKEEVLRGITGSILRSERDLHEE